MEWKLGDIYALAKAACVVGEPMVELPVDDLRMDQKGRVYVDLKALVDVLKAGCLSAERAPH